MSGPSLSPPPPPTESLLGPGPLDLESYSKSVKMEFWGIIDALSDQGKVALAVEPSLLSLLGHLVKPEEMREHGVEFWAKLEDGQLPLPSDSPVQHVSFLVRSHSENLESTAQLIATEILRLKANKHAKMTFSLIATPRVSERLSGALQRLGVLRAVSLYSWELYGVCLENDVITMDMEGVLREFYSGNDPSGLTSIARFIYALQTFFGRQSARKVLAVGKMARLTADSMLRVAREEVAFHALDQRKGGEFSVSHIIDPGVPPRKRGEEDPSDAGKLGCIDSIILVDRKVDPYSLFCSQFTYEALLDLQGGGEKGIHLGQLEVQNTLLGKEEEGTSRVALSKSADALFGQIRSLHVDKCGPLLNKKAREIDAVYQMRNQLQNIQEIRDFMPRFKTAQAEHRSLAMHTNLASEIKSQMQKKAFQEELKLEDDITSGSVSTSQLLDRIEQLTLPPSGPVPLWRVVRLLVLLSLAEGGLGAKPSASIRLAVAQAYGLGGGVVVALLERVGWLGHANTLGGLVPLQGSSWVKAKEVFRLIEETNVENSVAFAYSGYVPLSVRLVELAEAEGGWQGAAEKLRKIQGPAIEINQPSMPRPVEEEAVLALQGNQFKAKPTCLVVFVGGCTFGEIAALRKLEELEGKRSFVILTTEIVNTAKFVKGLVPPSVREEMVDLCKSEGGG